MLDKIKIIWYTVNNHKNKIPKSFLLKLLKKEQ